MKQTPVLKIVPMGDGMWMWHLWDGQACRAAGGPWRSPLECQAEFDKLRIACSKARTFVKKYRHPDTKKRIGFIK